jgi:stage II sporulation protein D
VRMARMSRTTRRLLVLTVTAALAVPTSAYAAAGERADRDRADRDGADRRAVSVTIEGRGYGHGHGMSQWGAHDAAEEGLGWKQILRFYYPRTKIARKGGLIRVEITGDTSRRNTIVLDRPGLKVKALKSGRTWKPRKTADRWRITAAAGGKSVVSYHQGRKWLRWKRITGDAEFSAGRNALTLLKPGGRTAYRGKLRNVAVGGHRATVNVLPIDHYLKGVVPQEVPASWPRHAVRAQAVAARTYAAHERAAHGTICDTTSCQVYGGYSAEHPDANAAIRATARRILTYGGKPAFTQFSASNGGWTAKGPFPYQPGKRDPYDDMYRSWSVTYSGNGITRNWPGMGRFVGFEDIQRDGNGPWGGRVLTLDVVGRNFTKQDVSMPTLMLWLGLRSTLFRNPTVNGS